MDIKDFSGSSAGTCIPVVGRDYWAFVPAPLPPQVLPSWELSALLSDADRALSELAGAGQLLPNPHALIQPAVRREAVLSSRIEGTQASLSDLFYFEAGAQEGRPEDVREVANYVKAMEHGLARLDSLPLGNRLLREVHKILMDGARGMQAMPGDFRASQNWIGAQGCTLNQATYVPPPVPEMLESLADLERYIHEPKIKQPPLVRAAFLHYQFEAIHPFGDGNGRVGRLLITLFLCDQQVLSQPLLYLSDYIERTRDEYYARLLAVSQRGEWEAWLHYFLTGIAEQARAGLASVRRLLVLRDELQQTVQGKRVPTAALRLVEHLFSNPVVSPAELARVWGDLTYPSVKLGVDYLVEKGCLREVTGRSRGQIFVCDKIMNVFDA